MGFQSIIFVFVMMPAAVLIISLAKGGLKQVLMLLVSLVFYAWGNPKHLPVLAGVIVFDYLVGKLIRHTRKRVRTLSSVCLVIAVSMHAALLIYCKYMSGFFPAGISFYTLSAISFLADIWRGRAKEPVTFMKTALYLAFFPKMPAGPVVQYAAVSGQIAHPKQTRELFASGAELFIIGLAKKVLLADNLAAAAATAAGAAAPSVVSQWIVLICFGLRFYYDVSGYSDMAVGMARMLGITLPRNSAWPHTSSSLLLFWRKWNISLGSWFRTYVYLPLKGRRRSLTRMIPAIIVVWVLIGAWHRAALPYLCFGAYSAVCLILEQFVLRRQLKRIPGVVRALLVTLCVFLGWVFFMGMDLQGTLGFFGSLIGIGGYPFINRTALYYLGGFFVLLVIAAAGCTRLPWIAYEAFAYRNILGRSSRVIQVLTTAATALLFLFVVAGMLGNASPEFILTGF